MDTKSSYRYAPAVLDRCTPIAAKITVYQCMPEICRTVAITQAAPFV